MELGRLRARHIVVGWLISRLALVVLVGLTGYLIGFDRDQRRADPWAWWAGRFSWADSFHYLRIADKGYLPPGLPCCDQAFFPGYPLAIRFLTPLLGGRPTLAGLLISHVAAAVAAVLLWRLAVRLTGDARVGVLAVLLLAVTPYGVFLSAVFTEALFLALSLGAWLAGVERRWWWAGMLAGLATVVRVNGVFLAAGLALMYLLQLRPAGTAGWDGGWRRPRVDALALLSPAIAVGGFVAYLHARTGSWTAWTDAQVIGWGRRTAWPWQGIQGGWHAIGHATTPDLFVAYVADVGFALAGVGLVLVLLWRRRWAETVYVAASVAVLLCSTTVQSSPRYALTWFPAYLMLAEGLVWLRDRRPGIWPSVVVIGLSLPVMGAIAIALAAHLWVA